MPTPVSTPTPAFNLASQIVRRRDTDQNDRIERKEWRGAPEQYDRFDKNDDGGISIEEIRARLATLPEAELKAMEASLNASSNKTGAAGAAGLGICGALLTAFPAGFGAMSGLVPLVLFGVGVVGAGAWIFLSIKDWGKTNAEDKLQALLTKIAG